MKRIMMMLAAALILSAPCGTVMSAMTQRSALESQDKAKKNVKDVIFATNMHCENCAKKLRENLAFAKGVKSLDISLEKQRIYISYDPSKTNEETLAGIIKKLGYKADVVKE